MIVHQEDEYSELLPRILQIMLSSLLFLIQSSLLFLSPSLLSSLSFSVCVKGQLGCLEHMGKVPRNYTKEKNTEML